MNDGETILLKTKMKKCQDSLLNFIDLKSSK